MRCVWSYVLVFLISPPYIHCCSVYYDIFEFMTTNIYPYAGWNSRLHRITHASIWLMLRFTLTNKKFYASVSQPPGRGPVAGPDIDYIGPSSYKKECTGPRSDNGWDPLVYVPLIWKAPHRKLLPKLFFHSGNVSNKLLPCNDKAIYRQTNRHTSPTILLVLLVFVAAGTCLPSRYLEMKGGT
jgi:hypothetical protein